MGVIICLYDKKLYLRENLIALPLEYISFRAFSPVTMSASIARV